MKPMMRELLAELDLHPYEGDDLTDMEGILEFAGPQFDRIWMYQKAVKLGFGIKLSPGRLRFSKSKFRAYIDGCYRTKPLGGS